jgi:CBS domain-containing protein
MSADNVFFVPVRDLCQREVVTCDQDESLVAAAEMMSERNISSIVVCSDQVPVGMVTDRDLRNKVVARGQDPGELRVGDIMNSPLVTIGEDDYLFEALHLMSRRRIHRLCVVDTSGALCGIVTDSDALRLQSRSPQQLVKEIEEACGDNVELQAVVLETIRGYKAATANGNQGGSRLGRLVAPALARRARA